MATDLIGQVLLEQYQVNKFIAAGGMGSVYQVWDLKRNVPLAMKVLHGELAEDPAMFKYFQREARALEKLAHPHIVPFYGMFKSGETAFMLELFVNGPNLKEVMQKKGRALNLQEALPYFKAVSAALGYAHANGVVHCDVKPGNVMMDEGGNIYLTDFGIARHAESSTTTLNSAGTVAYMPPEQILGQPVSPATDVYALGIMLFEMLTGKRPFRGSESGKGTASGVTVNERIRHEQLHQVAPNPCELTPGLPAGVGEAILKALRKDAGERYQTTSAFLGAVVQATGLNATEISTRANLDASFKHPEIQAASARVSSGAPAAGSLAGGSSGAGEKKKGRQLLIGLVATAILGIGAVFLVGGLVLMGGNMGGFGGALAAQASETPMPTKTSTLQATMVEPTRIPATSTADRALMTAEAVLTQAASLPKATQTPNKPNCPGDEMGYVKTYEEKGFFTIETCINNKVYKIGNLARGFVEMGPNRKFLVYITTNGVMYGVHYSRPTQTDQFGQLTTLTAINNDEGPDLRISFLGNHPYNVYVEELTHNQNETVHIPRYLTTANP